MEGPWGTIDPDKVEVEVGNYWRGLYKLEKQLSDSALAQKIAIKVYCIAWYLITFLPMKLVRMVF